MDCVLGIDLGTSYFKFALLDRAGGVRGASRIAVPASAPQPGRQEVDPDRFVGLLESGFAECCARAAIGPREIRGISYASQANSFILLDENGRPLTPLILWSDRRAGEPSDDLAGFWSRPDYLEATGMAIRDRELAIAKLDWIRRHEPEIWKRARRVLTVSDYLSYLLTGEAVGDTSSGALLGMQDIRTGGWWAPALAAVGLEEEQLARPQRPGTVSGSTGGPGLAALGLAEGTPFAVGALDHYAAAVGAGLGAFADTSESTGTVLACLHLHPQRRPAATYCTAPTAEQGLSYRLAFGPNGARGLELLFRRLGGSSSMEELSRLAAESPPGARGLRGAQVLSRPEDLDALFEGAARGRAPGDQARAIMESTALSLDELLGASCIEGRPERIVATGGGARSDTWLQIKADMLGMTVMASGNREPGCFGAALFASVAAGWYAGLSEAMRELVVIDKQFEPEESVHNFYTSWKTAGRGRA